MTDQYCTFYLNGLFFGIEVSIVQEVLRFQDMTSVPLAPAAISGLINLRGQIVSAIDLRRRLELPPRTDGQAPENVIVRVGEGAVSLLVDEIGDVVETDGLSFEPPPETLKGLARELIRGSFALKDCLLLVLDVDKTTNLGLAAGG